MRSSGEHNAPLSLICGEDNLLTWIGRVLAASATALILAGATSVGLKALLVLATIIYWWFVETRWRVSIKQRLAIHPSGRSECNGCHGLVMPDAWISSRYTFLAIKEDPGTRFVVVSASRQDPNEYRKLLAWMRHQRWSDH